MSSTPERRTRVRRILAIVTLATIPLYCLGVFVLQRVESQLRPNSSTSASSSTRVETLQVFVQATPAPGTSVTLPPLAITPTLSTVAEDFVRQYFQLIEQRSYSETWGLLTDHYRQLHNPTGYQPYVDFWNTVQSVAIGTVQTVAQDPQSARLLVPVTFHFIDGKSSTQSITFSLVVDSASGSWLIDDTY